MRVPIDNNRHPQKFPLMHDTTFLPDLAVVMIVAGLVTILFHKFKQPVVLGYIIAGVIIGPHTPPYPLIHDEETINTLAELGVILLMFSLGLEFSLRKLSQVGGTAFIAAFLEILLMVWLGYEIGRLFGWSTMDSLFLGAMLSISSTTIIVKALGELGLVKEHFAQLIFGILIIEDMLAIAMIALLSGIAMTGTVHVIDVGVTLGKLAIFLAVSLVIGLLTVPKLLGYVAGFKSSEVLLVSVLGLCFGNSLLAVKLGYSSALGAFLIGAVVAEARAIHRIESLVEPVRDMFSAIFFVSIGLLIDPTMLMAYWLPILVITLVVVVGKVIACSFGVFVGGHDTRTALRAGMGLAQIGEFSFIIATLGVTLKVTSDFLYPVAVAVSALTTLLTPYLIRSTDGLVRRFDRLAPKSLTRAMELYTSWMGRFSRRHQAMEVKLMQRWALHMGLNVALIAAVFIMAAYVGQHPPAMLVAHAGSGNAWFNPTLWLIAVVLSLPMIIATARKLQALGLLLAETRMPVGLLGSDVKQLKSLVAQMVPAVGLTILALFIIALSSAILPTVKVFLVLLLATACLSLFLHRTFARVYSRMQFALHETLAVPEDDSEKLPPGSLPAMLREARLLTLVMLPNSAAVGKCIRELQLRSRSGASIVGIERAGTNMINPTPEELIQVGDHVLLLGSELQLESAAQMLGGDLAQQTGEG